MPKRSTRMTTIVAAGIIALLVAGCSSESSTPSASPTPSGVVGTGATTWTPITVTVADEGKTITVVPEQVIVLDVEAKPGVDLFVASSDDNIARVEQAEGSGGVTAAPAVIGVSVGTAAIRVQAIDDSTDATPETLLAFTVSVQADAQPSRQAAGVEEETEDAEALAGNNLGRSLGSLVCVVNKTPGSINVSFNKYDTRSTDVESVASGLNVCAEGTFSSEPDVRAKVTAPGSPEIKMSAYNPALGYPSFKMTKTGQRGVCGSFFVDERMSLADGVHQFTVTRNKDTGWKKFTVEVVESTNTTPDGDCSTWHRTAR